jgi:hypothetical protein
MSTHTARMDSENLSLVSAENWIHLNWTIDSGNLSHAAAKNWTKIADLGNPIMSGFIVDTPGCRIPDMLAVTPIYQRYFKHNLHDPKVD